MALQGSGQRPSDCHGAQSVAQYSDCTDAWALPLRLRLRPGAWGATGAPGLLVTLRIYHSLDDS